MDCTKIIGEKIKALRTAQEITLEGTGRTYRTVQRTD